MDGLDIPPPRRIGFFDKVAFRIAGVDKETIRLCPQIDVDNVRAVAEIMVCVWIYQTVLLSISTHQLFAEAGQIRPDLILISMFLASFILLIDSYMIMRTGWHLVGIAELKRGGIDISGGASVRVKAGVFLAIRISLSVCIAQLTAIFIGILIFSSDIAPHIQSVYAQANAGLIFAATGLVDAQIKHATQTLDAESEREEALAAQVSALRQDKIAPSANRSELQDANQEVARLLLQQSRTDEALRNAESFASNELGGIRGAPGNSGIAGDGPIRQAAMEAVANAKNEARQISVALTTAQGRLDALRQQSVSINAAEKQQSEKELPVFEDALSREQSKVQVLRADLDRLTTGRDNTIRTAVEKAPNHIPAETGLLSKLVVLEHIAQADPKIAAVIILIDLTSFGFELAAVLAKVTSFVPTEYAARIARDSYMRIVRLVDGMVTELDHRPGEEESEVEVSAAPSQQPTPSRDMGSKANFDPFGNSGDPFSLSVKRPRGRPPKATSGEPPASPLPFGNGFSPDGS